MTVVNGPYGEINVDVVRFLNPELFRYKDGRWVVCLKYWTEDNKLVDLKGVGYTPYEACEAFYVALTTRSGKHETE